MKVKPSQKTTRRVPDTPIKPTLTQTTVAEIEIRMPGCACFPTSPRTSRRWDLVFFGMSLGAKLASSSMFFVQLMVCDVTVLFQHLFPQDSEGEIHQFSVAQYPYYDKGTLFGVGYFIRQARTKKR